MVVVDDEDDDDGISGSSVEGPTVAAVDNDVLLGVLRRYKFQTA